MTYHPDPGGVFASDTHRRVLGHLPLPGDAPIKAVDESNPDAKWRRAHSLAHRISGDAYHGLAGVDELGSVLAELEADGYAVSTAKGWKMTKKGLAALTAPVAENAPDAGAALLDGLTTGGVTRG